MNDHIQTSMEEINPGRLKRGLIRMLLITLEETIEIGMYEGLQSEFFSDLSALFDILDELKQIRKAAKRAK